MDFSAGGSVLCIVTCLLGVMIFAIPLGIISESVQTTLLLEHIQHISAEELSKMSSHRDGSSTQDEDILDLDVEKEPDVKVSTNPFNMLNQRRAESLRSRASLLTAASGASSASAREKASAGSKKSLRFASQASVH